MVGYYTGIGSRETPDKQKIRMREFAHILSKNYSLILRSGGADGADSAFESGTLQKQIFLPWPRFNGSESSYNYPLPWTYPIAERFHPKWRFLSPAAQKMMARNVHQVLGWRSPESTYDDPHSIMVVCYTKDGAESDEERTIETGGTGQAISIASYYNVTVFNLAKRSFLEIEDFLVPNPM